MINGVVNTASSASNSSFLAQSKQAAPQANDAKGQIENILKALGLDPQTIEQIMQSLGQQAPGTSSGSGGGGGPKSCQGSQRSQGSPRSQDTEQDPLQLLGQLLQALGLPPEQIQQLMGQLQQGAGGGGQFPGRGPDSDTPEQ
jgi:hypothetical protein